MNGFEFYRKEIMIQGNLIFLNVLTLNTALNKNSKYLNELITELKNFKFTLKK